MARKKSVELSRRERQIMDALYSLGRASAAAIREAIPNPPSYTAVRTHLSILHGRGQVKYSSDGTRYIYEPVVPRDEMAESAITRVMQTFFDNSVEKVISTLLKRKDSDLSAEQLDRLARMIEKARKEGR
jgi:predicted transcriptional regulator